MATRVTMPSENEPYTKGYYLIWGLLSLGAVLYIGFLAFGSDDKSLIKISKVDGKSAIEAKFSEQNRRLSSAMSMTVRTRDQVAVNGKRIEALEKRVQLLTWKVSENQTANTVSDYKPLEDTNANDHLKQVMGGAERASDVVGAVIPAPSEAKVHIPTALENAKQPTNDLAGIAGVVDAPPLPDPRDVAETAEKLSTLNPVKVAAAAAGMTPDEAAKPAQKITTEAVNSAASLPKTAPVEPTPEKVALKTPEPAAPKLAAPKKPPFANLPLPVRKAYGVRLTSGRSVEALRLTWDLLNEMNRPILKDLSTRFVEGPSAIGMPYRLIAGPMTSPAQAKNLCAKLHKQHINCAVTVFQGRRL